MEPSNSEKIKIGIFVFLGLLVISLSIFTLGSNSNMFSPKFYLTAEFDQVQGLSVGSVVSLSGITIGNISTIEYSSEKNVIIITMRINSGYKNLVHKGSTVEIRTQGALGDKYLYISPGPIELGVVDNGDQLTVNKSNDLLSVLSNRAGESEKVFDILKETYVLLQSINKNNKVENILKNLDQASVHLNSSSAKVSHILENSKISNSLEKMDQILAKIDRGDGTLGALINDPTLHQQIKKILGGQERQNHLKKVLRTSIEKE